MDRTRIARLLLAVYLVAAANASGQSRSSAYAALPGTETSAQFASEPAGEGRCQFCHAAEVEGYAQSAMAHSLRRAGREPSGEVATPDAKITIDSSPSGTWQRLESRGDTLSYRIDYVIGSGNHASGFLLDLNGHLFQSPVAYYNRLHAYALAPGYEGLQSPDFTRPVGDGCVFCHAGTALYIPGTSNQYRSPAFAGEAITCERCHGSAEKHLRDPRNGTIINPGKLEPAARDSICEQCHLLGVGRVLNPGMNFHDFRPGEPLENVFTTYVASPPPGQAIKFKVISHVEQLARSSCARGSNGALWCGTCHDPHNKPLEPVQFFRSKCLSCHTQTFSAAHPDRQSDCIACHMPRRQAKDGGHTAFTDHRIQRRPEPDSALPETSDIAAWRTPAPELEKRNLGIAYVNAGMERHSPPLIVRGYRLLTEVQQQFANDSAIFASMGSALLAGGQATEAELAFERALQLNPGSATGETNTASAHLQAGDSAQAIAHLERAIHIDPLYLAAAAPLIELYEQQGNAAKAAELSDSLNELVHKPSAESGVARKTPLERQLASAAFKNIQVLATIPSDQLRPAMRFMSASLGVGCNYCHVDGAFEKDDKKPKQIAREMMRMTFAINERNFSRSRQVTCDSCHRGSTRPEATPGFADGAPSKPTVLAADSKTVPGALPTADQAISRYEQALGGEAAMEKMITLHERGTTTAGSGSVRLDVWEEEPDKQISVRHLAAGDAETVVNGRQGWTRAPGHPAREMDAAELEAAQIDPRMLPLRLRQRCPELRVEYPEEIGGRPAYLLSCADVGKPPLQLYFDEHTWLLVRFVHYLPTPLGLLRSQIDYGDYRQVGGVNIAFRWTLAGADGRATTQLEEAEQNVPIDAGKFARPASLPGAQDVAGQ